MALAHRIKRLEQARGPIACPECGWGSGGPVVFNIPVPSIIGPDGIGGRDDRPRPEDFCPACGRKMVLRVPAPVVRRVTA